MKVKCVSQTGGLTIGQEYTAAAIQVDNFSTRILLKEFPLPEKKSVHIPKSPQLDYKCFDGVNFKTPEGGIPWMLKATKGKALSEFGNARLYILAHNDDLSMIKVAKMGTRVGAPESWAGNFYPRSDFKHVAPEELL